MEEKEIIELQRLKGLANAAITYRQQQRDKEYINNEAHYEGLHWNLANESENSPFIVKSDINHLANAVDIRLGSLYANTYYGILKPLSEYDVEKIEKLNIIYKNEWYRLNMDQLIEDAIKNCAIFDNGYIKFGYDVNSIVGSTNTRKEGKTTAKVLSTLNVYLDPSADSVYTCDYMIEIDNMTIEKIKRDKPEWFAKLEAHNIKGSAAKNNDTGNILVGRDYTTSQNNIVPITIVYEKVVKDIEVDENLDVLQEGVEGNIVEKIRAQRVKISYYTDDVLLEVNESYPFDIIPIIPIQWKKIPQSPYGTPLLRGLTVPQKVANLIESSINNIVIHYTVPTWLISEDSGLDVDEVAELINALGVVWKVTDVQTAIKQLEPPKLNNDIIQMGATFVNYIKEYAGSTSAYSGQIGTAGATASGASEAIGRATIIDNDPIKQITAFVENLSRTLIMFLVRYDKDVEMSIRSSEKDGKYSFNKITMDDSYSSMNFDFDVDLGARSKNDKNRQYNLKKEMYQLQLQYKDPNPVIRVTDLAKAAQLDDYNEMQNRLESVTDEAMAEKANLITQLIQIGNTITPNGQPLITAEVLQEGIMDVLNDDNDLSTAESIIQQYQEYQTAITDLKMNTQNNVGQV